MSPADQPGALLHGRHAGPPQSPAWSACKGEYRAVLGWNRESSALADKLQTIVELDLEELAAVGRSATWLRPRLTDGLLTAKAPYKPDPN